MGNVERTIRVNVLVEGRPHGAWPNEMICLYKHWGTLFGPITILDIIHSSFKTQLNSIGLPVSHRKHISSLLRAQQVNSIYRFVRMVY
jgi:hypothetical protein